MSVVRRGEILSSYNYSIPKQIKSQGGFYNAQINYYHLINNKHHFMRYSYNKHCKGDNKMAKRTLKQVSEDTGIPYGTLKNWKQGRRKPPEWVIFLLEEFYKNKDK